MLTERGFRCDRTLEQSPVSSFDRGDFRLVRPDAEGQRPVNSSKVQERENRDQTRLVSADQTLAASDHTVNTGVRGVLTGESGHPAETHNGSFFNPCYK